MPDKKHRDRPKTASLRLVPQPDRLATSRTFPEPEQREAAQHQQADLDAELAAERRQMRRSLLAVIAGERKATSPPSRPPSADPASDVAGRPHAPKTVSRLKSLVLSLRKRWNRTFAISRAVSASEHLARSPLDAEHDLRRIELEVELAQERRVMRRTLAEKLAKDYRKDSSSVDTQLLRGVLVDSDLAEEECAHLEQALAAARALAEVARDRRGVESPKDTDVG